MRTKEQHIIESAMALFAKYGYDQIGMDFIASESKVSKMTIYKYFPTKEKLFEAVLIEREKQFQKAILEKVNQQINPIDKIKSIFIFYHQWFNQNDFNGCLFINSTYIFANKNANFRQLIKSKKDVTRQFITDILSSVTVPKNAEKLAADIIKLLDGAIVAAQVKEAGENPAIDAWDAVLSLFKANNINDQSSLSF